MGNLDPIQKFLEAQRLAFVFSAYQIWAEHEGVSEHWSGGVNDYWKNEKTGDQQYFDIGSVTKAVVTASCFARAVDRGQIDLQDKVEKFLSKAPQPIGKLALFNLLSHSAGLKDWLPYYQSKGTGLSTWIGENATQLLLPASPARAVYSDIGFWILGLVMEKVWGSIPAAFDAEVKKPLGLKQVVFGPIAAEKAVATEYREGHEGALRGIVFDENCEAMGGTGAHAGLFATASGLAVWARAWLDAIQGRSKWLSAKTASTFTTTANVHLGTWAFGWDTKSKSASSAGNHFSEKSFGHLGYPGASVWIDPKEDAFLVTLTNRVHPSRLDERIRVFRPAFHDLIHSRWQKSRSGESRV